MPASHASMKSVTTRRPRTSRTKDWKRKLDRAAARRDLSPHPRPLDISADARQLAQYGGIRARGSVQPNHQAAERGATPEALVAFGIACQIGYVDRLSLASSPPASRARA